MADTNGTDHLVVRHEKSRVAANGFDNDGYHPCDWPDGEDRRLTNGGGHHHRRRHREPPSNGTAVVVLQDDDDETTTRVAETAVPLDTRLGHHAPALACDVKYSNGDGGTYVTIPEEELHTFTSEKQLLESLSAATRKRPKKERIPLKEMAPPPPRYEQKDGAAPAKNHHKNGGESLWTSDKNPFADDMRQESEFKVAQGNGTAKPEDDFSTPANNHRKCLSEGEKLYLREDSRKLCQGKRRLIICGLIAIIVAVALLVGVLAATGILLAESEGKNSRPPSSSAAVAGLLPPVRPRPPLEGGPPQPRPPAVVSQAPPPPSSPVSPIVPVFQNESAQARVPNALVGEFTITNENFTEDLADDSSADYKFLTQHLETELRRIFKRNGANFESIKILSFRSGSIKVHFVVVWDSKKGILVSHQALEMLQAHLKKSHNLLLAYTIDSQNIVFEDVFDECKIQNGGCSYRCEMNYFTLSKTCVCKESEFLLSDGVTCALNITEGSTSSFAENANKSATTEPFLPVTEILTISELDSQSQNSNISSESTTTIRLIVTDTTSENVENDTEKTFIEILKENSTATPESTMPYELSSISSGHDSSTAVESTESTHLLISEENIHPQTISNETDATTITASPNTVPTVHPELNMTGETTENIQNATDLVEMTTEPFNPVNSSINLTPETTETQLYNLSDPTTEMHQMGSVEVETKLQDHMNTTTDSYPVNVFSNVSTFYTNPPVTTSPIIPLSDIYNESTTVDTVQAITTNISEVTTPSVDESEIESSIVNLDITTVPPMLFDTTLTAHYNESSLPSDSFPNLNSTESKPFEDYSNPPDNVTLPEIANVSDAATKGSRSHELESDSTDFPALTTTPFSAEIVTIVSEINNISDPSIAANQATPLVTEMIDNISVDDIFHFNTSSIVNTTEIDDPQRNTTEPSSNLTVEYASVTLETLTAIPGITDKYQTTTPIETTEITHEFSSLSPSNITSEAITHPFTAATLVTLQEDMLITTPGTFTMSETPPAISQENSTAKPLENATGTGTDATSTMLPQLTTAEQRNTSGALAIDGMSSTTSTPLELDPVWPSSEDTNAIELYTNRTSVNHTFDSNGTLSETATSIYVEGNATAVNVLENATDLPLATEHYNLSTISSVQYTGDNYTTENIFIIDENSTIANFSGEISENSTEYSTKSDVIEVDTNSTLGYFNFTIIPTISPSLKSNDSADILNEQNETFPLTDVTLSHSNLTENDSSTEALSLNENAADSFSFGSNFTEAAGFNLSEVEVNTLLPLDFNLTGINITLFGGNSTYVLNESLQELNFTLNGTDATGIECREDQFICEELNICLNNTFLCDGIADCPDGEDETDCRDTCYTNFMCNNSTTCIMNEARCDGIIDCEDGSDEQNCTPTECAKHEVMCTDNSKCIKPGHICDWKYNCRDRSDEVGCVERTTCEQLGRFFCNDGLCIPWSLKCDGDFDCKDGEDEGNCTCLSDEFRCTDGQCLKSSSRCDGHQDCHDAADEQGCVTVDDQGTVSTYEPYSAAWALLCAEDWGLDDGHYLCQELGFGHALSTEKYRTSFNGTWMGMRRENLTSTSLWTERVSFVESCTSSLAAAVTCQKFDCGNYSGLLHRRKREEAPSSSTSTWPFIGFASTFQSSRGCLAEILTPIWLVTSAECLLSVGKEPHNGSEWYVRTNVGQGFVGDSAQNHEVLKIISHPHSSKFRSLILRDYDLALIRLRHALVFSDKVGAICLPEEQVPSGITCFSGVLGTEKPRAPPPTSITINSLALMVLDRESCNIPRHYNNQVNQRMLCTRSSDSQSICDNDEGTPLMCLSEPNKWYLAGMLTYQRYCAVYNWHPAVFSNLFSMKKLIHKITGQKQYEVPYDSSLYVILPPTTPSPTEPETTFMMSTAIDTTTTEFPLVADKLHFEPGGFFDQFRSGNDSEMTTVAFENGTALLDYATDVPLVDMAFDMVNASEVDNGTVDEPVVIRTRGFVLGDAKPSPQLEASNLTRIYIIDNNTDIPDAHVASFDGGNSTDSELTNMTIVWLNATELDIKTTLLGAVDSKKQGKTNVTEDGILLYYDVFNATDFNNTSEMNATDFNNTSEMNATDLNISSGMIATDSNIITEMNATALNVSSEMNATDFNITSKANSTDFNIITEMNATALNTSSEIYATDLNTTSKANSTNLNFITEINATALNISSEMNATDLNTSTANSTDLSNAVEMYKTDFNDLEAKNATNLKLKIVNETHEPLLMGFNATILPFSNSKTENATEITADEIRSERLESTLEDNNKSYAYPENFIKVNLTYENQTLHRKTNTDDIANTPLKKELNDTGYSIAMNSTNTLYRIMNTFVDSNDTSDIVNMETITSGDGAITVLDVESKNNSVIPKFEKYRLLITPDEDIAQNITSLYRNNSVRSVNALQETNAILSAKKSENNTAYKFLINGSDVTALMGDLKDPNSFSEVPLNSSLELDAQNVNNSLLEEPVVVLINENSILSLTPNETLNDNLSTKKQLVYNDGLNKNTSLSDSCGIWDRNEAVQVAAGNTSDAAFAEWPALGYLKLVPEPEKICACAILTSRFVLTSFSCLLSRGKPPYPSDWTFVGGHFNTSSWSLGSQSRPVQQILPCPTALLSDEADFALVQLKSEIEWSKSSTHVCLPGQEVASAHRTCFMPTWHKTIAEDNFGKSFHAIPMNLLSSEQCNDTDHYNGTIQDSSICTSYNNTDFNSCQVDAGLPLFCTNEDQRWEIHGLSKLPISCDTKSFPVYNGIRGIQNWISETLKTHS